MSASEVALLAAAIRGRHSAPPPGRDYIWTAPPAQKVIDCVLSLNRRYDSVVLPRVLSFAEAHPNATSVSHLRAMIDAAASPAEFLRAALRTNDARRALTLNGVVDYMIAIQRGLAGSGEEERLQNWAKAARPEDFKRVGVKGFGLAGFQYMRMLFCAETTKPDVHIIAFVSGEIGRQVSDVEALHLLEQAAASAGVPPRWLDVSIWESRARPTAKPLPGLT